MSSPLAFDKQGKPFSFHPSTRQLRVRLFRTPSARGTCTPVLGADGSPLYIVQDTEYQLFRQLVGHVPGLYRLDQCDDEGAEVDDAPPAHVSVDPLRNAQPLDSTNDHVSALAVIREMAVVQREMAAIQGQALKALADSHAQILASAAEVMRAPRPAPAPAELRNASDYDKIDSDDEYEDDTNYEDNDTEKDPSSGGPVGLIAQFVKMIDPKDARKLGSWLMAKFMQFRQETATAAQATAPLDVAAALVNAASPVAVETAPVSVVAAPAPVVSSPISTTEIAVPADIVANENDAATSSTLPLAEPTTSDLPGGAEPQVATPPLTHEQFMHIATINAQLSPEEQVIAEQVMRRMGVSTMQRWLFALSSMSVDEATATVREAIAERTLRRTTGLPTLVTL